MPCSINIYPSRPPIILPVLVINVPVIIVSSPGLPILTPPPLSSYSSIYLRPSLFFPRSLVLILFYSISIFRIAKRKKKKCAILSYPLPSSPPHNTIYHIYSPILVFDHCFQILPSFQHLSYACVLYSLFVLVHSWVRMDCFFLLREEGMRG